MWEGSLITEVLEIREASVLVFPNSEQELSLFPDYTQDSAPEVCGATNLRPTPTHPAGQDSD